MTKYYVATLENCLEIYYDPDRKKYYCEDRHDGLIFHTCGSTTEDAIAYAKERGYDGAILREMGMETLYRWEDVS